MKTFSALLALCEGNSPVTGEFPAQRPVMWNFDVFYDLRLDERLSKQLGGWWFETPSRPLWRHCNYSGSWRWSVAAESPAKLKVKNMDILTLTYYLLRPILRHLTWLSSEHTYLFHPESGPLFTKKTPSYGYGNPHYKPKTVWRPSRVYNGNPILIRRRLLSE